MTRARRFVPALAVLCAALGACPDNAGIDPPLDRFFYPTALAVGHDGRWLYVVSSDFDLTYNGGTVAAVDLACVRARAADPTLRRCPGLTDAADITCDGSNVCLTSGFVRASQTRKVNPFAADAAWAAYPDRSRLYVAVRGDGSVTWFDTDDQGRLECGADGAGGLCSDGYRVGVDESQSPTAARLPPDPSALSIDPARGWVLVTHQNTDNNQGRASLIRDRAASGGTGTPVLLNVVGGVSLGLTDAALLPRAGDADPARSTWMTVSRSEPSINLFQAYPGNPAIGDGGPLLYRSAVVPVRGLSTGANSRAIALDPAPDAARAFVISRSPEALLTLRWSPSNPADVSVTDAFPLPQGPSRLTVVREAEQTLVYAVSYDARRVTVLDPDARRVVASIPTGRGPHAIVVDPTPGQRFLYVVDFLDSALEVIDLRPPADPASPGTYHRRVLTLGPALPTS